MPTSPSDQPRSRAGWAVLTVLLVLEGVLLAWVALIAILASFGSHGVQMQVVSLLIMAFAVLGWIVATLIGALRSRVSWVRGSALTIHVLLFAAGTGCLQLAIGPWWFGFGIVAAALLGFAAAILARPRTGVPAA
ncbi:hypothetical protein D3248_06820 [Leucobacter zeae]|nr:hypothetical protein [Leucobacter zeae]